MGQPSVDLGNDTLICSDISLTLDGGNPGARYYWSTHENTREITVYETGTYWLTVEDQNGIASDEITIIFLNEKFNQANNWMFGAGAGIAFDYWSTAPTASYGQPFSGGSSSISDDDGNLVLYTNGSVIYNKDHEPVMNGENLEGDSNSYYNSLIVPQPRSASLFNVYTYSPGKGIHYSVVDTRENNGQGAVIEKDIPLNINGDHRLTTTEAADGMNYWLVSHNAGSNKYKSYFITRNGVDSTVITNAGPSFSGEGTIKFSPYGDKIAVTGNDKVSIFSFNKSTGQLYNPVTVDIPGAEGVEFSRGNNKLYISSYSENDIYQLTIKPMTETGIRSSITKIHEGIPGDKSPADIQLGIDGKLYVANEGDNCLGVISDPDSTGIYDPAGFCLPTNVESGRSLPKYPQHYFAFPLGSDIVVHDTCAGEPALIDGYSPLEEYDFTNLTYSYDFGDGTTGSGPETYHTYQSGGTYTVSVDVSSGCGSNTVSTDIFITSRPEPVLNDTSSCEGDSILLDPGTGPDNEYLWSTGETADSILVDKSGTYSVEVMKGKCLIKESAEIKILARPAPELKKEDIYVCEEKDETVELKAHNGVVYFWEPMGTGGSSIIVDTQGWYHVNVIASNGCNTRDSIFVPDLCEAEVYAPEAFSPNGDRINDVFKVEGKYVLDFVLRIYDRWGELIYQSTDMNKGWDGRYKGKIAQQGAYGYVITYSSNTDKGILPKTKKGNFILIR